MISIFLDYFFCHLVRREREISRMQTFDETIEEFGFQLLLLFQDTSNIHYPHNHNFRNYDRYGFFNYPRTNIPSTIILGKQLRKFTISNL